MPSEVSEPVPVSAGFSAQVNGASVADLVQMYCQTRARAAIEVRSGLQIGYLFFDRGRLVHAELGSLVGEIAFVRILGFAAGAFQPSLRAWPNQESIGCAVEELLLRAAQALDESRRRKPATALPEPFTPNDAVRVSVTRSVGVPRPEAFGAASSNATKASTLTSPASGVRVDPAGAVISQRGARAESLADLVAFVAPVLGVIGEELGLGDCGGIDMYCTHETEVLLRHEPDGSWVGAVGPASELLELRRRMGGG